VSNVPVEIQRRQNERYENDANRKRPDRILRSRKLLLKTLAKGLTEEQAEDLWASMFAIVASYENNAPAAVQAMKLIKETMLGKPQQHVQIEQTHTLNIEQRRELVLRELGIIPEAEVIKCLPALEVAEGDARPLLPSVPALPAETDTGSEPVHSGGEGPTRGDVVDNGVQDSLSSVLSPEAS
jgi:hypothetical protein